MCNVHHLIKSKAKHMPITKCLEHVWLKIATLFLPIRQYYQLLDFYPCWGAHSGQSIFSISDTHQIIAFCYTDYAVIWQVFKIKKIVDWLPTSSSWPHFSWSAQDLALAQSSEVCEPLQLTASVSHAICSCRTLELYSRHGYLKSNRGELVTDRVSRSPRTGVCW